MSGGSGNPAFKAARARYLSDPANAERRRLSALKGAATRRARKAATVVPEPDAVPSANYDIAPDIQAVAELVAELVARQVHGAQEQIENLRRDNEQLRQKLAERNHLTTELIRLRDIADKYENLRRLLK